MIYGGMGAMAPSQVTCLVTDDDIQKLVDQWGEGSPFVAAARATQAQCKQAVAAAAGDHPAIQSAALWLGLAAGGLLLASFFVKRP